MGMPDPLACLMRRCSWPPSVDCPFLLPAEMLYKERADFKFSKHKELWGVIPPSRSGASWAEAPKDIYGFHPSSFSHIQCLIELGFHHSLGSGRNTKCYFYFKCYTECKFFSLFILLQMGSPRSRKCLSFRFPIIPLEKTFIWDLLGKFA